MRQRRPTMTSCNRLCWTVVSIPTCTMGAVAAPALTMPLLRRTIGLQTVFVALAYLHEDIIQVVSGKDRVIFVQADMVFSRCTSIWFL